MSPGWLTGGGRAQLRVGPRQRLPPEVRVPVQLLQNGELTIAHSPSRRSLLRLDRRRISRLRQVEVRRVRLEVRPYTYIFT
jgi:hypothetical protein